MDRKKNVSGLFQDQDFFLNPLCCCLSLALQVTRYWDWYVEYLGTRGFGGLRDFIKVNIQPTANRQSTAQPLSQPPQSQSSQSTESSYCSPSQAY